LLGTLSDGRGVAPFVDGRCIAHILQRIFELSFASSVIVGRMHAVAYVGASISDFNMLVQCMCTVVSSQLYYVQCSSVPNDPCRHAESVLDLTLLRPLRTRGRNDGEAVEHDRTMWKRSLFAQHCQRGLALFPFASLLRWALRRSV